MQQKSGVLVIGVFILVGAVLAGATAAGVYFAAEQSRRAAIAEKLRLEAMAAESLEISKKSVSDILLLLKSNRNADALTVLRLSNEFESLANSPTATLDDYSELFDRAAKILESTKKP